MWIKMIGYYLIGSLLWFIIFGFLAAASGLRIQIINSFVTLTIGVFMGFLIRDKFAEKPWLFIFVPLLQLIIGMF